MFSVRKTRERTFLNAIFYQIWSYNCPRFGSKEVITLFEISFQCEGADKSCLNSGAKDMRSLPLVRVNLLARHSVRVLKVSVTSQSSINTESG